MSKKVKVIVKKDYLNIGKKNTIIHLSRGYVFNYLLPEGIVEVATSNKLKHLSMFNLIKEEKVKESEIKSINLHKNLTLLKKITLSKKIGENNLIFGSVNEKEVLNQINKYTNIFLEKKQIKIPEIKKIGIFNIEINLSNDKLCYLQLNIHPSNI